MTREIALACALLTGGKAALACTNILVTKGASADGSVVVSYSVDGEFLPLLRYTPAADHALGDVFEVKGRNGVDDTYTTCYFPLFAGITAVPPSFGTGTLQGFSWDSAWWVYNPVANYAQLKFSYMVKNIQAVQQELEGNFCAMQTAVETTAVGKLNSDPARTRRFLTDYSVSAGEQVTRRWKELAAKLFTKYNDG